MKLDELIPGEWYAALDQPQGYGGKRVRAPVARKVEFLGLTKRLGIQNEVVKRRARARVLNGPVGRGQIAGAPEGTVVVIGANQIIRTWAKHTSTASRPLR